MFFFNLPFPAFDIRTKLAKAAPVSCPTIVTLVGSPPNAGMLSRVHFSAAIMSIKPKFPPEPGDGEARVFRKPLITKKKLSENYE